MADGDSGSKRTARKCAEISRILVREELKARVKQVIMDVSTHRCT